MRQRPSAVRMGWTHKAVIESSIEGRIKFFFTVNENEKGRPVELFLHMDESGSLLDGFCDAWSIMVSMYLQMDGADLETFLRKFAFVEFEPKGMCEDSQIRFAKSILDYVCRKIALHYDLCLC